MTSQKLVRNPPKHVRKRRLPRWTRDLAVLGVFVGILLSARASLADHYRVPSGSMRPTLKEGDRIVVSKLAYGLRVPFTSRYVTESDGPARGEVIVFRSPDDGETLVKRVVGLPGDRVAVLAGRLWLNGNRVHLSTSRDGPREHLGTRVYHLSFERGGGPDFGPARVPPGHYFMLGDNRGDSFDSRGFGWVPRRSLLGRAVAVYWRGGFTWRKL